LSTGGLLVRGFPDQFKAPACLVKGRVNVPDCIHKFSVDALRKIHFFPIYVEFNVA
jgi:hypothetical protein